MLRFKLAKAFEILVTLKFLPFWSKKMNTFLFIFYIAAKKNITYGLPNPHFEIDFAHETQSANHGFCFQMACTGQACTGHFMACELATQAATIFIAQKTLLLQV